MSILDLLLEKDIKTLQKNNFKDYEVKRLSGFIGEAFVIRCQALTTEKIKYIGEVTKNDTDVKAYTILEGCLIEGKKIGSQELLSKFSVATPVELINKLFLPGEISELYSEISELSGFGQDYVIEIKN